MPLRVVLRRVSRVVVVECVVPVWPALVCLDLLHWPSRGVPAVLTRVCFCISNGRGLRFLCPAGRFNSSEQATECAGTPCSAGYFCVAGSSSATPASGACTNPAFFCPEGSASQRPVGAGNFSVAFTRVVGQASIQLYVAGVWLALVLPACALRPSHTRTPHSRMRMPYLRFSVDGDFPCPSCLHLCCTESVCPAGTYCVGGVQQACPVGTFSNATGATGVGNCQPCAVGHFCPANSTVSVPCGDPRFYCVDGVRMNVTIGFYSTPTTPGSEQFRVNQTVCEPGFYCSLGNRTACPEGRYGTASGQTGAECGTWPRALPPRPRGVCVKGGVQGSPSRSVPRSPCAGCLCRLCVASLHPCRVACALRDRWRRHKW